MVSNPRPQQVPTQWSAKSFAIQAPGAVPLAYSNKAHTGSRPTPAPGAPPPPIKPPTTAQRQSVVETQPSNARGGPVSVARKGSASVPNAGSASAPISRNSFQSASSFNFFKLPGQNASGAFEFTNNLAAASAYPSFNSEAPLAHCNSSASYANDNQEELNLHPSMANLKKNKRTPFEADALSILKGVMGDELSEGVPVAVERSMRQSNPLQKTESQLIVAHAQALALQEQRRRTQAQAAPQKVPSPIRGILATKRYPQKIYLMRHGESEANISRRDVPDPNLTNLGLAQAKSWQETIGDLGADIVLVSPLRRAVQTACHAFHYEEVPFLLCRFAREIGWSCNENTIHSTPASLKKMLETLPRGDEVEGVDQALTAGVDDPADEMASLQRLKVVLASRPENTIVVVCHFGVIAATCGCRAKNGDIYECDWGYNDELRVVGRHKTPLADHSCICG